MAERRKSIEILLEDIQALKKRVFFGAASNCQTGRITASQWFVVRHLGKSAGTTLKEVAQSLNVTSSAATQLVEALVRKGYIVKKIGSPDRRELELRLSDKSKKHLAELRRKRLAEMTKIFGVLTDQEFSAYCRLFNKVAASLSSKEKL
jgi:DNA-binding MarR family transcriptional regulator